MSRVASRVRCAFFLLVGLVLLAGCTGANMVGLDITDYRDVFGETADRQVLEAILRAKDKSPLHFNELQTMGASIQLTSSLQATDPIAKPNNSTQRASVTGNLSAQNSPNFSLSTLETQGFTKGLLSPVEPTLIKQFLDEGVDPRLVFWLFFSGIRTPQGMIYQNNLECESQESFCHKHWYKYAEFVNLAGGKKIVANIYTELTPIGGDYDTTAVSVKDLAGIDMTKFRLQVAPKLDEHGERVTKKDEKNRIVELYSTMMYSVSSPKIIFCFEQNGHLYEFLSLPKLVRSPACRNSEVDVGDVQRDKQLTVRSAYQIIQYLGQVLRWQEERAAEDRCLKLGRDDGHRNCHEFDVFFKVNSDRGVPLARTFHDGRSYAINVGDCTPGVYCDHSAEVLKILSLLINWNKSAQDIPQVPLIRTVQ